MLSLVVVRTGGGPGAPSAATPRASSQRASISIRLLLIKHHRHSRAVHLIFFLVIERLRAAVRANDLLSSVFLCYDWENRA